MRLLVLLVALASGLRADLFSSADISGSISSPPWIDSGVTASGNCHGATDCQLDLSIPDLSVSLTAFANATYGSLSVSSSNEIIALTEWPLDGAAAVSTASASFSDQIYLGGNYAFVRFTLWNSWLQAIVPLVTNNLSLLFDGSPADLLPTANVSCYGFEVGSACTGSWTTPILPVNGDAFSMSVLANVSAHGFELPSPEVHSQVELESIQFFGADEQPIENAYYHSLSDSQYPVINGHVVPEPKSVWLFGSVLLITACCRRRRALAPDRRRAR